jgi:hypothetical protein
VTAVGKVLAVKGQVEKEPEAREVAAGTVRAVVRVATALAEVPVAHRHQNQKHHQ